MSVYYHYRSIGQVYLYFVPVIIGVATQHYRNASDLINTLYIIDWLLIARH